MHVHSATHSHTHIHIHTYACTAVRIHTYTQVSALVTSVLDGYNVCIMAYGQTGSGKTFTMEGPDGDPGVNTRALGELFKCV